MTASAWLPRLRPLVGPLVLIVLIAFFGALYPGTFLSQQNLLVNILETVSFLIIVAAAQTVVMVVGDFDLSVSGLAALATSFTAAMLATTTLAGEARIRRSCRWLSASALRSASSVGSSTACSWPISVCSLHRHVGDLGGGLFESRGHCASTGKPGLQPRR